MAQPHERRRQPLEVGQDNGMRLLHLHHQTCVGHVLCGCAPMYIAPRIPVTQRRQLPDERHQFVRGVVNALLEPWKIDQFDVCLGCDLICRRLRHQSGRDFGPRQCRFEI